MRLEDRAEKFATESTGWSARSRPARSAEPDHRPERAAAGTERRRGWLVLWVMRELAARLRVHWGAVPRRERSRWLRIMTAGFVCLAALMVVLAWIAPLLAARGALAWEAGFLRSIEARLPLSFSYAVWIQTFGSDITLALVVVLLGGGAIWHGRALTGLSLIGAYALMDPIIRLGWVLWDRARPTIILQGVASPGFDSFPSGHTAKTLAVYGLLTLLWAGAARRWSERVLALGIGSVIVVAVGIGRLRMGVHWPSDILAGALLGAVWLLFLVAALPRRQPRG